MPYYSFKIKKGKVELEVLSENKYFILNKFDNFYRDLTEKKASPKKIDSIVIPAEKKAEPANSEIIQPVEEKPSTVPEIENKKPEPEILEEIETAVLEEKTDTEQKVSEPVEIIEESVQKAVKQDIEELFSSKKIEINQSTEDEEDEKQEEDEIEAETIEIQNEFQKIIEQKMQEDIEITDFPEESEEEVEEDEETEEETQEIEEELKETITFYEDTEEEVEKDEEIDEKIQESTDSEEEELAEILRESFEEEEKPKKNSKVYDILQEKLSSLPEEEKSRLNLNRAPSEYKKASSSIKFKGLEDLLYLKKPQTKLDYLLITSYFLQETEQKEKYSLKQINSKVIPHLKEPVDHSVIHEAVAHGYFKVVPDYSGTSDITEYAITSEGVDYLLNEL
ncbi:MAG TPA: hypothetical protein P5556_04185 [Candidatus Gastranaerophilales bacterium]|nr:hypothetical protein [Candidatus Gastranaerophilales bacterium]